MGCELHAAPSLIRKSIEYYKYNKAGSSRPDCHCYCCLKHLTLIYFLFYFYFFLLYSFIMSQKFYPGSARNWFTLDTVTLQNQGQSVSFSGKEGIYAPVEYSFHCQSVTNYLYPLLMPNASNHDLNTSQWRIHFVDFQVKVFF